MYVGLGAHDLTVCIFCLPHGLRLCILKKVRCKTAHLYKHCDPGLIHLYWKPECEIKTFFYKKRTISYLFSSLLILQRAVNDNPQALKIVFSLLLLQIIGFQQFPA